MTCRHDNIVRVTTLPIDNKCLEHNLIDIFACKDCGVLMVNPENLGSIVEAKKMEPSK